jgi:uncharacterized protein with HEPN domain
VSRHDDERLADVLTAIAAIGQHLERGSLDDGLVFDAVRMRLVEIGEAVKDLSPEVVATEPEIRWQGIARMRDRLAHHYYDTSHAVLERTIAEDLPALEAAVRRMAGT